MKNKFNDDDDDDDDDNINVGNKKSYLICTKNV